MRDTSVLSSVAAGTYEEGIIVQHGLLSKPKCGVLVEGAKVKLGMWRHMAGSWDDDRIGPWKCLLQEVSLSLRASMFTPFHRSSASPSEAH